jgi:phytoene synthase
VTTAADELSSLTQTVREQDRDRYLATLFAPAAARDALFALYAFYQEIARARRIASEPMIALIRLQWWRDALDGLERGRVLAHPVVEALDRAIAGGRLTPAPLEQAISGREHEVEDPPPADLDCLEAHLADTHGAIVRAAFGALDSDQEGRGRLADQIGMARGYLELAGWLYGGGRPDQLWLPATFLAAHGAPSEQPATDAPADPAASDRLRQALARRGQEHLRAARASVDRSAAALLPALLPATLAAPPLADHAAGRPPRARPGAPFRLLWSWLRGRI